jgi:hypothetical protein
MLSNTPEMIEVHYAVPASWATLPSVEQARLKGRQGIRFALQDGMFEPFDLGTAPITVHRDGSR